MSAHRRSSDGPRTPLPAFIRFLCASFANGIIGHVVATEWLGWGQGVTLVYIIAAMACLPLLEAPRGRHRK